MRNIEEIAWDLCCLYDDSKSSINENGEFEYCIAGSLATLALINADKIEDIVLDENGKVLEIKDEREIGENAKDTFKKFRRKIGDIDYSVLGREPLFEERRKILDGIKNIEDINELSDKGDRIISSSDFREQNCSFNLSRITHGDKSIIIPSPIDMASFKLSQSIRMIEFIHRNENIEDEEKKNSRINKGIVKLDKMKKDFGILIEGVRELYSEEIVINRMIEVLKSENALNENAINEFKMMFEGNMKIIDFLDGLLDEIKKEQLDDMFNEENIDDSNLVRKNI